MTYAFQRTSQITHSCFFDMEIKEVGIAVPRLYARTEVSCDAQGLLWPSNNLQYFSSLTHALSTLPPTPPPPPESGMTFSLFLLSIQILPLCLFVFSGLK